MNYTLKTKRFPANPCKNKDHIVGHGVFVEINGYKNYLKGIEYNYCPICGRSLEEYWKKAKAKRINTL